MKVFHDNVWNNIVFSQTWSFSFCRAISFSCTSLLSRLVLSITQSKMPWGQINTGYLKYPLQHHACEWQVDVTLHFVNLQIVCFFVLTAPFLPVFTFSEGNKEFSVHVINVTKCNSRSGVTYQATPKYSFFSWTAFKKIGYTTTTHPKFCNAGNWQTLFKSKSPYLPTLSFALHRRAQIIFLVPPKFAA